MSTAAAALTVEAPGTSGPRVTRAPSASFEDDTALNILAALPRDHAPWARDTVTLSVRARALLAALRPLVVVALTFWSHASRAFTAGGRRLHIDPSGSYRIEERAVPSV